MASSLVDNPAVSEDERKAIRRLLEEYLQRQRRSVGRLVAGHPELPTLLWAARELDAGRLVDVAAESRLPFLIREDLRVLERLQASIGEYIAWRDREVAQRRAGGGALWRLRFDTAAVAWSLDLEHVAFCPACEQLAVFVRTEAGVFRRQPFCSFQPAHRLIGLEEARRKGVVEADGGRFWRVRRPAAPAWFM